MDTGANLKTRLHNLSEPAKLALLIIVASKILVLAVGYLTTYLNLGPAPPLEVFQNLFNRWDAPSYVDIAKNGYLASGDQANFIVFFPLYPLLIKAFTFDFTYGNITALAISNVCSLIAFFYLYKLAKYEFGEGVALKAVLFLSIFPTAYFLSVPYTEGLFFALLIAGFYYARLGKWYLAGTLSFFASLTRLAGLLLVPVFVVEYLHQRGWKPRKVGWSFLWVFAAIGGFLIYLNLNNQVTGNPFTFITVEAQHWSNSFDPLSGLDRALYWSRAYPYPTNLSSGIAPLFFACFGLAMICAAVWRRLRPSYTLYMLLTWGLAVSTSWWVSVPRYILAMFPMFFLFGLLIKGKAATAAVVVASGIGLLYFTVLFALGWWAF
jgi:hypothetical protein